MRDLERCGECGCKRTRHSSAGDHTGCPCGCEAFEPQPHEVERCPLCLWPRHLDPEGEQHNCPYTNLSPTGCTW